MPGGPWACYRGKNHKNGAIWCILSVPKYVIMNLKITNFKDDESTTKIIRIFSNINPDVHASTKINTFTFYKYQVNFKKNQTKWRLFI